MEYGKVVKSEHKPQVNEKLVREMEERLKLMNRRRVKKNKKKGEEEERDEDDSDFDEEKEKSTKAKDPLNEDDED